MRLVIHPGHPLRGVVTLPGDKSLSHRAALFAALAEGESRIDNFLVARVTQVMLDGLAGLGVPWNLEGTNLQVVGRGLGGLRAPARALDCGHSGTTMRMLAGALAAAGVPAVLDGSSRLRERPMARIVDPLRAMGVPITAAPHGGAPLRLEARSAAQPLRALHYPMPVPSAQVKTAILLAALAAEGPTTVLESGQSRDHTERLLASMGVRIRTSSIVGDGHPFAVTLEPPVEPLRSFALSLPGDFSSAAFLIVAALITPGSEITLLNVGLNPTRTGLLDALAGMGAAVRVIPRPDRYGEPVGDIEVRHSELGGYSVSGPLVVRMIDEFPAFAVAAATALGPSRVREARELRYKEADRITALAQGLGALGAEVREAEDGLDLPGSARFVGGAVQSYGDHRLAMAQAVAGLAAGSPVIVHGAEIIAQSFPGFHQALQALGANIAVQDSESAP